MAAVAEQIPPGKLRWEELEEDEDGDDFSYLLPPPVVVSPDENGVKNLVENIFNDAGDKVRVTTTTRTRKLARARLSKKALERRSWAKFGNAIREDAGSRLTMVSTEEILLERPHPPGSTVEEVKTPDPLVAAVAKAGAVLMVCRTCHKKGDHWTARCPYKDLTLPTDTFIDMPLASETATPATGAQTGAYVPPGMRRGGGSGKRSVPDRCRDDKNSVRVTNLSEDTQGNRTCSSFSVHLVPSAVCTLPWIKRLESAGALGLSILSTGKMQRAINKLNGYGYDNLVLRVELATPRAN